MFREMLCQQSLTGDALCHDVCHFAAGRQHPHAQLVHDQCLAMAVVQIWLIALHVANNKSLLFANYLHFMILACLL